MASPCGSIQASDRLACRSDSNHMVYADNPDEFHPKMDRFLTASYA